MEKPSLPDTVLARKTFDPLPMTSFDLFEINGHQETRPSLTAVNQLINGASKMSLKGVFCQCVCLYKGCPIFTPSDLRKAAVLGLDRSHYRIFLPFYEVEEAIALVFQSPMESDISILYRIYQQVLEWIHPLTDMNGRVMRLWLTVLVRSRGIPFLMKKGSSAESITTAAANKK